MQSIYDIANELGFVYVNELDNYRNKNRFYHNEQHVVDMIEYVDNNYQIFSAHEKRLLKVAILFHDIIYTPGSKTNEWDSWLVCEKVCNGYEIYNDIKDQFLLKEMIMATKDHNLKSDSSDFVKAIIMADLHAFSLIDFKKVWANNYAIFKEFQIFDWVDFKKGQIDFLINFKNKIEWFMPAIAKQNMTDIITPMNIWQPKIAIYPGSFNPFHVGHLNILEKAEKIFDKVIIARGINPEKNNEMLPLPNMLNHYQVDTYEGLLTDYVASKPYPVTIIRGLRNSTDMAYEQNQYRWLQDLNPEINVVSLFCDKEYEHVSSSGIRLMTKFGKQEKYLLK